MNSAAKIRIRPFRKTEIDEVAALIARTFARFNGREGTPAATKRYLGHYGHGPERAELEGKYFSATVCLVAVAGAEVAGILRCNGEWVRNLFVDGRYHRQGIGSRLLEECERLFRQKGLQVIRLNSTLYALPFYEALGFRKTTGLRRKGGLVYQPMKKIIK